MGFFSIFKKQKPSKEDSTPKEILQSFFEEIPGKYHSHQHFQEAAHFFAANLFEQTLFSLIDLGTEPNQYFSEDYWNSLSLVASSLGLPQKSEFCLLQKERTKQAIGLKIAKGTTLEKVANGQYKKHISTFVWDQWANSRRQKDGLNAFINKNGFHQKQHGRDGTIYYVEKGRVLEIYCEMSGVPQYDLLLVFEKLNHWSIPKNEPISSEKKSDIKKKLEQWLQNNQTKAELR
ncbi:MAG TPA: hypothetical protein PLS07_15225 [Niabella sp.]|nr:hypothetical protein [Niabella sp.]HQW15855.1 hypothetical protein [Niabella sp.]HQX21067.1 hypothetical protein [Niabella sp.]HQX40888.1 hypothetical protein [Niabella sp.]HRB36896.1 hypothetical protein [Niabella sp.]